MLEKLKANPVIPVIVIENDNDACPLAEALLKGGMDVIEITFRTNAAAAAIQKIKKEFPQMLLGAGTVITPEKAKIAVDVGVDFALAPGTNPTIISYFKGHDILFIPGVMTPSDIESALSLDCTNLKFFPAVQAGGVSMLKALSAPYVSTGVTFCPTGGISLENMNDYLSLPFVSNVGGSWLATKQQIAGKEWLTITNQAKAALSRAREVK